MANAARRYRRVLTLLATSSLLGAAGGLAQVGEAPPRPQTPAPPFPYVERDAGYANPADGSRFAGRLSVPAGAGPYPAVLLIPGSGESDRDGTVEGHKPLLVIADHLARHGVAVLRADSRPAAALEPATLEDLAGDALAALAYLGNQPGIDASRIGLVGHSLGGMVAPLAAARSRSVAFVVLLAAPGLPARDLDRLQLAVRLRSAGTPEAEVPRLVDESTALLDRVSEGDDAPATRAGLESLIRSVLPPEMAMPPDAFEALVSQQVRALRSRSYRFLRTHDPRDSLRRMRCPVLAIGGSLDQAVPPREHLGEIEKALREGGNTERTVAELYGLNHFFQTAGTGSPTEIAEIAETFSPNALALMTGWVRQRAGLEPPSPPR